MKNKLLWAIVAFIVGFMVFLGVHQYVGAAIICVGLVLADQYSDDRKKSKQFETNKEKM